MKLPSNMQVSNQLQKILLVIGLITIITLAIGLLPRGLGLYFQIKGANNIDRLMTSYKNNIPAGFTCISLPEGNDIDQTSAMNAKIDLLKSANYFPSADYTYLLLGRTYCLLGEPENAIDAYHKYIELRPQNPLGYLELGFAYEKLGNTEAAVGSWKDSEVSLNNFRKVGNQALNKQQYRKALHWFTRTTLLYPNDPKAWLGVGAAYEGLSDLNEAKKAYRIAREIDPELSTLALANLLKKQNKNSASEVLLRQVLNDFPESIYRLEWWRLLGNLQQKQKYWDEAISVFEQAIMEFPNEPDLRISLGWAIYERGDKPNRALKMFRKSIQLDNESGNGQYAIGQLFEREERYNEADEWYRKAIYRSPDKHIYFLSRANNAVKDNDLELAIKIYNNIITRFPNVTSAYYKLAGVYLKSNQSEEAISAIEDAINRQKKPNENYYLLAAEIYEQYGDNQRALEAFSKVLNINPQNSSAQKGIERITDN